MFIKLVAFAIVALIQTIALPLYLIFYPYRIAVTFFVKCFKKEFGRILDPASALLSDDDHTKSPFHIGVAISLTIDGKLTLEELIQEFTGNVLEATDSNSKLLYPELRQYCSDFMGYRFWKNDDNFSLSNHIYKIKSDKEMPTLSSIHQHFVNKIFPEKRSPWELVLVENFFPKEDSTLVIFREHHYLGDGNSMSNLLTKSLGQKPVKAAKTTEIKLNWKHRVWTWLSFPFEYISGLAPAIESLILTWNHPFRIPEATRRKGYAYNSFSEKTVQVQDLKMVAKLANVRVSSMLHSIVGGAVGKFSHIIEETKQIPIVCSQGRPTHPDFLTNEMDGIIVQLLTDVSSSTALERARYFNEQLISLTDNNKRALYSQLKILGSFPNIFRLMVANLLQRYTGVLMSVSNMPFDDEGFSIRKYPVREFLATTGCNQCSHGLLVYLQSYKGNVRFTVVSNNNLFHKEDGDRLAALLYEEFVCLKEEVNLLKLKKKL